MSSESISFSSVYDFEFSKSSFYSMSLKGSEIGSIPSKVSILSKLLEKLAFS